MARAIAAVAALALATFAGRSTALGSPPTLYDYDYNGVTTYCYWVKQGLQVASFDYSYVKLEGKNTECPLLVTITQNTKGVLYAGSDVEYQFTATLNFNDNKFGMTALEATVPDPVTKRPAQIVHANVHACSRTTVCDVFRDGSNRRISNQETSNFTDEKALFTQKVNFAAAGDYNVFAHIVLPPKNALNETYQFVTFTTTTITPIADTLSKSSGGTSTGVMVGAIIGAVVVLLAIVVGVIFYRRKRPSSLMAPGNDHFRHSGGGYAVSNTAKSKASRLDWNGDPDYQFGHDRYQASMVSEYNKQAPALSASALMFQDNASSRNGKQKTVSSGGSSHRSANSPRFRDQNRFGQDNFGAYYDNDRYGPDNGTFATDSSVGTSNAYPSDAHLYAPTGGPSRRGAPYPYPESDYGYDGLQSVSEVDRDSVASMGTVDFALPPPLPLDTGVRATGDSFRAEDVPNLAATNLAFNDEEISKQTIEYIDSLRQQQDYRDTEQASDYVSDFGSTNRTFDFRDSDKSDMVYGQTFRRNSDDDDLTDTAYRQNKRAASNDSESYEF